MEWEIFRILLKHVSQCFLICMTVPLVPETPPLSYIFLYNFLVTHPNFMKFGDFSYNLSGIHILNLFFEIRTGFCSVSTFSRPGVIFLCFFCWKNEYILESIGRISV